MRKRLSILIALAAASMIAVATVMPAFAGTAALNVDSCYGEGYSYYTNAQGGTEEYYNNSSCLRWLDYTYYSPDGIGGYVGPGPEQSFSNISHYQSFSTDVQSCHQLIYEFDGSGEKCTTGY